MEREIEHHAESYLPDNDSEPWKQQHREKPKLKPSEDPAEIEKARLQGLRDLENLKKKMENKKPLNH